MWFEWERAKKRKKKKSKSERSWWQFADTSRVPNNRESGCSFSTVVRCLGANLSGDAERYLERRVINEGRAEFGYGGGGLRMINLNELSCRLHINCRGHNVWLTEGCSLLKTNNKKRLHHTLSHQPPLKLQIHLNGWWQNNYLALTPCTAAAGDVHAGWRAHIHTCFQKLR